MRQRVVITVVALLSASVYVKPSEASVVEPTSAVISPAAPVPPQAAVRPAADQLKEYRARLVEARNRLPSDGVAMHDTREHCFSTRFPSTIWREVACLPRPTSVQAVRRRKGPSTPTSKVVGALPGGGGVIDYFARMSVGVTGVIGTFPTVDVKSESGIRPIDNTVQPDTYSIQINPNSYISKLCESISTCDDTWTQFVYSNSDCGGDACIEIEYQLIDAQQCPPTAGWFVNPGNGGEPSCVLNATGPPIPHLTWADLANAAFIALANANTDTFILSAPDGSASMVIAPSQGLGQSWWITEFNLLGDSNGTAATFSNGTSTLELNLSVQWTGNEAVTCSRSGGSDVQTGESSNLSLGPCIASGSSIQFTESGGIPAPVPPPPPSCAQLASDISKQQELVTDLTNHPGSCPSGIVAICGQPLNDAITVLDKLKAQYTEMHCLPK